MNFDEISNQIWEGMASTQQGIGTSKENPFINEFYIDGVNFPGLIKFLASVKGKSEIEFYWENFKGLSYSLNPFTGKTTVSTNGDDVSVPYTYSTDLGITIEVYPTAVLNKRKGFIDDNWGYGIAIEPQNQKIECHITFYYWKTENYRDFTKDESHQYFEMSPKYKAVTIVTNDLTAFCRIIKDVGGDETNYQKKISDKFIGLIRASNTPAQLNFLYSNVPDFAIEPIAKDLGEDTLMTHLEILRFVFKVQPTDKWLVNTTSMITIFRMLTLDGGTKKLYDLLIKKQRVVRDIYYSMYGSSIVDHNLESNYVIFANLMYLLCMRHGFEGLHSKSGKYEKFYVGKGFFVDSNVAPGSDEIPDKIFLRQFKQKVTEDWFSGDFLTPHMQTRSKNSGRYYDPFDLVLFQDLSKENSFAILVPAIFVKAIADQKEWKDIQQAIRIGVSALALILGAASFGTASPLIMAAAILDVGIEIVDLITIINEDWLMQTTEGRKFLELWGHVSIVGGILTAGTGLLGEVFDQGAKLLVKKTLAAEADAFSGREFVKNCLERMINEEDLGQNVLIQSSILIEDRPDEIFRLLFNEFPKQNIQSLQDAGVVFARGLLVKSENELGVMLVYKNKLIAIGDTDQVNAVLKNIWSRKGKNLVKSLDDLPEIKKLFDFDNLGQFLTDADFKTVESFLLNETKKLRKKFGKNVEVKLEIGSEFGDWTVPGFFLGDGKPVVLEATAAGMFITDGTKMAVVLRPGATIHVVQHELMHYKQCRKNINAYYNMPKTHGNTYFSRLAREEYVYKQLLKYRNTLTRFEVLETLDYMNSVSRKVAEQTNTTAKNYKLNFDINSIPETREEVDISSIFKLIEKP